MEKKFKLPKFRNENQERGFWSRIKLDKHFKPGDFESVSLPELKPTSHPISIRVPNAILFRIKEQANELGIPYQSLIKQYLAEGVRR